MTGCVLFAQMFVQITYRPTNGRGDPDVSSRGSCFAYDLHEIRFVRLRSGATGQTVPRAGGKGRRWSWSWRGNNIGVELRTLFTKMYKMLSKCECCYELQSIHCNECGTTSASSAQATPLMRANGDRWGAGSVAEYAAILSIEHCLLVYKIT